MEKTNILILSYFTLLINFNIYSQEKVNTEVKKNLKDKVIKKKQIIKSKNVKKNKEQEIKIDNNIVENLNNKNIKNIENIEDLTEIKNQKVKEPYISMADVSIDKDIDKEQKELEEKEISDEKELPNLEGRVLEQRDNKFKKNIYLAEYTEPFKGIASEDNLEMNFENQELSQLLKFLEDNLNITFILDDDISGAKVEGLKPIANHKITFKSNTGLSLKQVWDLSLTFLEMSGFSVIPTTQERTYRVVSSHGKASANSEPLPTFISTDRDLLPNSDLKIRYVYFVENADLNSMVKVLDSIRSDSSAGIIQFPDLRAIIITDKSSSIKSMLNIIKELDKSDTPETLAIIRLKNADASEVAALYSNLVGAEEQRTPFGIQRKTPTTNYFSKATKLFPDLRTNSLIILGTRENIKRIEDFVNTYIDKKSDLPYTPINIYKLKYLDATSISKILSDAINKFNADPKIKEVAAAGGVREGSKFFNPNLKIVPESGSNSLIVNGEYEDYLKLKELLDSIDIEQPQVALKVLLLDVDLTNVREFGTQSRNDVACCDKTGGTTSILGPNINYQFAGLNGMVTQPETTTSGAERLLGNLINLVDTQKFPTGTTLVTLGKDLYGFWGLLKALESITRITVVANPFLVTSNKYKAEITIGETRRVLSSIVQAQQTQPSFANLDANLTVLLTPQISYDDIITLDVYVNLSQFITTGELPTIATKLVNTTVMAENKEVIALGGLVRDTVREEEYKVPILGDIPVLGWLFKAKTKTTVRTSLLILISPEIIRPNDYKLAQEYTEYQINDVKEAIYSSEHLAEKRDPIHRWFFKDNQSPEISQIDKFSANQSKYVSETQKEIESIEENKRLLAQNELEKIPKSLLDIVKQDSNAEQVTT